MGSLISKLCWLGCTACQGKGRKENKKKWGLTQIKCQTLKKKISYANQLLPSTAKMFEYLNKNLKVLDAKYFLDKKFISCKCVKF